MTVKRHYASFDHYFGDQIGLKTLLQAPSHSSHRSILSWLKTSALLTYLFLDGGWSENIPYDQIHLTFEQMVLKSRNSQQK